MNVLDYLYHIGAAFILILGTFVLLDNFRQKKSWVFFLWALNASAWMLTLYWGFWFSEQGFWDATLITFRFAFATSVLMLSLMTVFFYYFPRVSIKVNPFIRYAYLAFTAFLVFAALTPLIHEALVIEGGVYTADKLGPAYPLYTFDIVLNFFLALYLAIRKFLIAGTIERKKIAFSSGGYFIFVFFAILTNVVLPYFEIYPLFLQQLVPYLTLVFIIPAYISIQRFRFFNLTYASLQLTRRLIFYTIFLILVWFFYRLTMSINPNLGGSLTVGMSILISIYLLEKLDEHTPEFLGEELKGFKNAMTELRTSLYSCDSYARLQQVVEETFLLKLNFVHTKLYVVLKEKKNIKLPIHIKDKFTTLLETLNPDILVKDEIPYQRFDSRTKNTLLNALDKMGADVCIPLFSEQNLIGFLALKRKAETTSVPREEMKEILAIKRDLEVTLMNVLLKLNLEEENNMMKTIIDRRTKQLKNKILEINELLKQQSDFIAVTAHEFRTPLSIAMFQLDEVKDKSKKTDLADELEVINHSLDNLKELTQKLFSVQQYDLKKVDVKMEKIDIHSFVKDVFKDFTPIMKQKKFKFTLHSELLAKTHVTADTAQLRQVFHNLLNNAYKFTPEGGKIGLNMGMKNKDVFISVADNGEGIPDDMKLSVFAKFRTKKAGHGIGLGLYLCKKIVELHKGKIWVQDAKGGGAEFCVQLKKSAK